MDGIYLFLLNSPTTFSEVCVWHRGHAEPTKHFNPRTSVAFMRLDNSLAGFREEWADFLGRRNHKIRTTRGPGCVVQSRDAAGHRYRWILFVTIGRSKVLCTMDRASIEHHLTVGLHQKQKVYLVIRFGDGINKVLVLPAERVRKRKRILARKGGIPWND